MLSLLQLFLAIFAIYSAMKFPEEIRLLVPLGTLVAMLIVGRIDKMKAEAEKERKNLLKREMEEAWNKEATSIKEQDFFTLDSLLWPKSEFILIDAVHFILRDMKFKVSAGVNYKSVDRIVRIPGSPMAFGVEVLMSEGEVDKRHPKIIRALEFEGEKKEKEKTLIIAGTHIHLQLSERDRVKHVSKEMIDLLAKYHISFMTTYHLYQLWQKAKGGEIDIFEIFKKLYSHPGGVFPPKRFGSSLSLSFDLPT
jgi:hypothetical protein